MSLSVKFSYASLAFCLLYFIIPPCKILILLHARILWEWRASTPCLLIFFFLLRVEINPWKISILSKIFAAKMSLNFLPLRKRRQANQILAVVLHSAGRVIWAQTLMTSLNWTLYWCLPTLSISLIYLKTYVFDRRVLDSTPMFAYSFSFLNIHVDKSTCVWQTCSGGNKKPEQTLTVSIWLLCPIHFHII